MNRTLRTLSLLVACVMLLCCAFAQTAFAADELTFTPGTYTASFRGRNADLTVCITVDEHAILSVEVPEHFETQGIGTIAVTNVPAQIMERQSLDVDVVTGATLTRAAILYAAEDCLTQAGADISLLKQHVAAKAEPIEMTADVIVVGAGGAGMSAATTVLEQGMSVIIVERNAYVGGNTMTSGGGYNACDPVRQADVDSNPGLQRQLESYLDEDPANYGDFGPALATLQDQIREYLAGDTTKIFDSVELHIFQAYNATVRTDMNGNTIIPDYNLVRIMCENALPTIDWLEDMGIVWQDFTNTLAGAIWPRTHHPVAPDGSTGTGIVYTDTLAERVLEFGGTILLETRANELIYENDRVAGVTATTSAGTPVTLHANKGVILCSGGYAANFEMCCEFNTYWDNLEKIRITSNLVSTQGDGITMARKLGADTVGMGFIQLLPLDVSDGAAGSTAWLGGGADYMVLVNKEGKRFVNEYAARDVLCSSTLAQTDGQMFDVSDAAILRAANRSEKYIADQAILNHYVVADTLEELAGLMGVPADDFVAEIEKYNTFTHNGLDEDFNRTSIGMPLEEGPFYASLKAPGTHHTMGGLRIDTGARVLDTDGNAIAGLYAAGEVTGGIHAGNRIGGNAIADCLIFGRIAGNSIVND